MPTSTTASSNIPSWQERSAMYYSVKNDEIFQRKPQYSRPSHFQLKSWTDTVQGYCHEAKRLTHCILQNRGLMQRPYSWFVTIYIWKTMSPKEATALWSKVCRSLRRQGVVALWVREPSKNNRIHYHLLVSSRISRAELVRAIKAAMPPRKEIGWHQGIRKNNDTIWLAYYLTKAKIRGWRKGNYSSDKYAAKRLLFKPGLNIKKYGTIGPFWVRPVKALWKAKQDRERAIAEGLADDNIRLLARHAYELIGGYIPLVKVERSFGVSAADPMVQAWAKAVSDETASITSHDACAA